MSLSFSTFPQEVPKAAKKTLAAAVVELQAHFSELLNRMVLDSYLQKEIGEDRSAVENDPSRAKYKLGVRFFNECDKMQLAYSYFTATGQVNSHRSVVSVLLRPQAHACFDRIRIETC